MNGIADPTLGGTEEFVAGARLAGELDTTWQGQDEKEERIHGRCERQMVKSIAGGCRPQNQSVPQSRPRYPIPTLW